jgi:basic amino acid/polyamine antiporter, APA family
MTEKKSYELVPRLGLLSSTAIVIGSMLGSGIFIVSADIARVVVSPALLIAAWVVTGFLTIAAALSYGELAAMFPKAGGQYVYLRESLGKPFGFLYGWTLFTVIQTGTIAALGVAFGKFLGHFFPSVSSHNWIWHMAHVPAIPVGPMVLGNMDIGLNTVTAVAIVVIWALTFINIFGVRTGAVVQNVFTVTKTAALLGLIGVGAIVGANQQALKANFADFWHNAALHAQHVLPQGSTSIIVSTLTIIAVAQVGSLFSADAWNNVTFTAGEIIHPKRNVPLSLLLGTGLVTLLYIAANFVYLMVLPLAGDPQGTTVLARGIQFATEDRVGTAVMQQMFGSQGADLMALAILISVFGCCNGLILSGARVYYAMAKDKLFFKSAATVHPKYRTPVYSLLMQAAWSSLLCLSGSYSQLLDYIIFAVLVFYILTIGGLFVLRRTQPSTPRPYRALGYPLLPAAYIVVAFFIDVVLLLYKPQYTWPGLVIVLLGIPVYYFWSGSDIARSRRA